MNVIWSGLARNKSACVVGSEERGSAVHESYLSRYKVRGTWTRRLPPIAGCGGNDRRMPEQCTLDAAVLTLFALLFTLVGSGGTIFVIWCCSPRNQPAQGRGPGNGV